MSAPVNFTAPIINLNGSDAQGLMDDLRAAATALDDAIRKMRTCAPHGRDFQTSPVGEALTLRAQKEHNERVGQVERVRSTLFDIWSAIDDQVADRRGG